MEREVKFYIADLNALRAGLERIDAVLMQPRTRELNLRFDTPDGRLTRNAQVLRLRRDTASRLTFKGPQRIRDGIGERVEIEFTVGDFTQTRALLEALGYRVALIYEKQRAIYNVNGTLVTLDEMPFGDFAEIEGETGKRIREVCLQLGLRWEARTLQSYTRLFATVKRNLGLTFRDLTFENFEGIRVAPSHLEMIPADL